MPDNNLKSDTRIKRDIQIAIAQCLAWQSDVSVDDITKTLDKIAKGLQSPFDTLETLDDLEKFLAENEKLWHQKIGLVYGGATKIKGYVFESADLQEIRGASALLDRINLIDLPAFFQGETSARFEQCQSAQSYCERLRSGWLREHFPILENAFIPEMLIYSTGGNILAFCPADLINDLTNAVEKRYTLETLTANACAVGATFSPLEVYLGLLKTKNTLWSNTIEDYKDNPALQAYFGFKKSDNAQTVKDAFRQRKGFSELTGKLANQFNQRRSGDQSLRRPSRRHPPMFETHPYLMRDDSDRRLAVVQVPANQLPDTPKLAEPTARKRIIGQITKRENFGGSWYLGRRSAFRQTISGQGSLWKPGPATSWINKFEAFLVNPQKGHFVSDYDSEHRIFNQNWKIVDPFKREARSLTEIGAASNGYVAYIYADGNNMGQYIRDKIRTPEQYQEFSRDIFNATQESVYWALARNLHPYKYTPDAQSSRRNRHPVWIHPFEIITIGGDDVLLVVPANKALEIAKAIGERFETLLAQTGRYSLEPAETKDSKTCHRYKSDTAPLSKSRLSISSGVLITAANTPIYYADKLVSQLLKSAKKKAKDLRNKGYYGGTVDFLTLKAVTMISSNIDSFRSEGLTIRFPDRKQDLKLYAAPYTLHELGGLIGTVQAVKESGFPKSQLYQIRSFLEQGKRTVILNYRYFKVRLQKASDRMLLQQEFEEAWCNAETNNGNLAPWMILQRRENSNDNQSDKTANSDKTIYETLWRELVELYEFIEVPEGTTDSQGETSQSVPSEGVSS